MTIKMYDLAGKDPERRFSPFCWRIRMALAHKRLPVEAVAWRFLDKNQIAFADSTTVPVIVDGANTVADSWKIALYLDEKYNDRMMLFGNEAAVGATLFMRQWTERVIHLALIRVVLLDIYDVLDEPNQAYFRQSREKRFGMTLEQFVENKEDNIAKLRDLLAPARAVIATQLYFGGTAPSFADYILFGAFQWARCVSPTKLLAADDALYTWRDRMLSLYNGLAKKAVGFEV
ncbi:MAG: glutathione S-transferase family protein [Burkholderiales bacterium]